MEIINELLPYEDINNKWLAGRMNSDGARILTLNQVESFEKIIGDDEGWKYLLTAFNNGRDTDAWLATDWPHGFDELLLCVPLCKFVDFECSKCTVGKRQDNNSCANDFSLFGYIAELLKISDRHGLLNHISSVKKILLSTDYKWNIDTKKIEMIQTNFPAANPEAQAH